MEVCMYCNVTIAPREPSVTIATTSGEYVFHDNHYYELLTKTNRGFLDFLKQFGLPQTLAVRFSDLETAWQVAQSVVDHILGSITDEDKQIELLVPFWRMIRRVKLFYTPTVPEQLKARIEAELAPKPESKPEPPPPPSPPPKSRQPLQPTVGMEVDPEFSTSRLEKTKAALPQLRFDMLAIAQRPFELVLDPTIATGATDGRNYIHLNPYPIEASMPELAIGTGYHEAGHIRYSYHLTGVMSRAHAEGGEVLAHLVNLIMDNHDDARNTREAPGFADVLRGRLKWLFPDHRGRNPWEDFAYACKKGTTPRFPESSKAVRLVRRFVKGRQWTTDAVLAIAKQVRSILSGHLPPVEQTFQEQGFRLLMLAIAGVEAGPGLTQRQKQELEQAMSGILSGERKLALKQLQQLLKQLPTQKGLLLPMPTAPHRRKVTQPEFKRFEALVPGPYRRIVNSVRNHVNRLKAKMTLIDSPVEATERYQQEGDLDVSNLARLVVGFDDCFELTTLESELDAEIHLALDQSGSMVGEKIGFARQVGVLFNEAILGKQPYVDGHLWGYNSNGKATIFDYGPCRFSSPVVLAEADGGNSDYEMLSVIAKQIVRSRRKKRLVILVGDDGPSSPDMVNKLANQLLGAGIPVIHIMVGVFAAPKIFPIQLLFRTFPELIDGFGDILFKIFRWM